MLHQKNIPQRDGGGTMQWLICDRCEVRRGWDTWYTAVGALPTGWYLVMAFDGRYYYPEGHLCPACAPPGASHGNESYARLWAAYQQQRVLVHNRPAGWQAPRTYLLEET